jgi:hypothetical protein
MSTLAGVISYDTAICRRVLTGPLSARPIAVRVRKLIWNTIGLIDIIFVVFSALRFGLKDWQLMHALRELPLSLLPTFLVPLIIASHVLIFVRLLRAPTWFAVTAGQKIGRLGGELKPTATALPLS